MVANVPGASKLLPPLLLVSVFCPQASSDTLCLPAPLLVVVVTPAVVLPPFPDRTGLPESPLFHSHCRLAYMVPLALLGLLPLAA